MTISEALQQTQGHGAGMMNQASVRYAQTLLLPEETVSAAVVANVSARGERFPGVVALTNRRVIAACGLPGIKRFLSIELEQLEKCEEKPTAINYKAIFYGADQSFSMTIDPEIGEAFSRHIAIMNGDVEAFDAAAQNLDSGIFNPALIRSRRRMQQSRIKHAEELKMARKERQQAAVTHTSEPVDEDESAQAAAVRLAQQLDAARAKGYVADTDPKAVAARLAAELAAEEVEHNASELN